MVWLLVLGCLTVSAGCTRTASQTDAVEARLRGLTLRQQVAQMLVVTADLTPGGAGPGLEWLRPWIWEAGVGGVMPRGGSAIETARALDTLQSAARLPLLVVADVSQGLGGAFTGATELPPAYRIAVALGPEAAEQAGRLAGREARAIGVGLALVRSPPLNGDEPSPLPLQEETRQGIALGAYLRGLRAEGVLAGVATFTTEEEPSAPLPHVVRWDRARLEAVELPALKGVLREGTDAVLLDAIELPALSADTLPLLLSPTAVRGLLRRDLGWEGLVLADLQTLAPDRDQTQTALAAVAAGVDLLLGITDPAAVIEAISRAVEEGRLPRTRVESAARRILRAKTRLPQPLSRVDSLPRLRSPEALRDAGALAERLEARTGSAGPIGQRLRRLSAAEVGMSESALARVDSVITRGIAAGLFPGAALAVGRRGGLVRLRGYGRVGREPESPAVDAEETLYDLASLTKVVGTTAAVMALVEAGALALDAPLQRYLPEWNAVDAAPARGGNARSTPAAAGRESVTLRRLLSHTGGLPAGQDLYGRASAPEEALRHVVGAPMVLEPGQVALYSDLGMILLGEVAQRAASEPLDRFLAWRVFAPLGMSSTMFLPPLALWPQTATTALTSERDFVLKGIVHDGNAYRLGGVAGHAGLFSTARDLAVFAQMLLNGGSYDGVRILAPGTVSAFARRQPAAGERALGWDTPSPESSAGSYFSARSFGHTGYTGTSIWIDPERDLFVVLLTNRTYDRTPNRQMLEMRREIHDGISRAITDLPLVRRPGAIERISPPQVRPPVPPPVRTPPPRSPPARRP